MRFLTKAEYPLVVLVLLSLAGKVASNRQDQKNDAFEQNFATSVVRQLSEAGFTTTVEQWPTGVALQAQRDACRMWVRENNPHGTMRNIYDELAKPVGPLLYIYRGASFQKPPKLDPMLRFFFNREMAHLGIATSRFPVYAVALSAACDISSIAWPVELG